jgi:hypothetical protein
VQESEDRKKESEGAGGEKEIDGERWKVDKQPSKEKRLEGP